MFNDWQVIRIPALYFPSKYFRAGVPSKGTISISIAPFSF